MVARYFHLQTWFLPSKLQTSYYEIFPCCSQGYTETNEKKNLDLEGNLNIQKETGVKDKLCLPKTENKISNNNDQAANIEVPKKTTGKYYLFNEFVFSSNEGFLKFFGSQFDEPDKLTIF